MHSLFHLKYVSRLTMVSARQPPQDMFGQHATAAKVRALLHQFEKRILAIRADQSHVFQIDDQLAAVQLLAGASPRAFHLRRPRGNQFAFQYQPTLATGLDDRHSEHLRDACLGCGTTLAKLGCAHKSQNCIEKDETERRRVSKNVEAFIDRCRRCRRQSAISNQSMRCAVHDECFFTWLRFEELNADCCVLTAARLMRRYAGRCPAFSCGKSEWCASGQDGRRRPAGRRLGPWSHEECGEFRRAR